MMSADASSLNKKKTQKNVQIPRHTAAPREFLPEVAVLQLNFFFKEEKNTNKTECVYPTSRL
jgi:hypothetical protein